jgi:alkylated DNA repair dioxygenase AlkB
MCLRNSHRSFSCARNGRAIAYRPAGLQYLEEWISEDEQRALLCAIDKEPWLTDLARRVQHYGYKYDYRARQVDSGMHLGPLPAWSLSITRRLSGDGLMRPPDQMIVNEYLPGQGIAPHIDGIACFGPVIASLSLGSACVMSLTLGSERVLIRLRPRSLLLLAEDARCRWRHGIAARKSDIWEGARMPRGRRVSLTFRTVRV